MKKTKNFLLITFFILIAIFLFGPKEVLSAEGVTAEQIVTSIDGSIDYLFKGLTLESGASYEWAIEKSKDATIANWYSVNAPNYTAGEVRISILASNENQLAILKSTDTAYVSIRKVGENTNILDGYEVDLTLPLLKAFNMSKSQWYGGVPTNPAYDLTTIYGIVATNVSYKWEKITDANIVNNYIDNNHDLSGLKLKGRESFPSLSDTSWKSVRNGASSSGIIYNKEMPSEDGLYYLWLQASDTDVKTIYGQAIVEVGTVEKITSNNSGTNGGNNGGNNGGSSNGGSNNGGQSTTPKGNSAGKTDPTTSGKILPNTGVNAIIIGAILLVALFAIMGAKQCHKYKEVK